MCSQQTQNHLLAVRVITFGLFEQQKKLNPHQLLKKTQSMEWSPPEQSTWGRADRHRTEEPANSFERVFWFHGDSWVLVSYSDGTFYVLIGTLLLKAKMVQGSVIIIWRRGYTKDSETRFGKNHVWYMRTILFFTNIVADYCSYLQYGFAVSCEP